MKKLFNLMLVAFVLLNAGCSRQYTITQSPMEYLVHGIADVTINQYQDTTFYIVPNIEYVSGPQESMTLALSSVPAGVYPSPSSISGTPGFSGVIAVHCIINTAGTFPVTVTGSSATGSKTYTFNIHVVPVDPMVYDITAPTTNITLAQYTYTMLPMSLGATYHSGHKEDITITPTSTATGLYFDPVSYMGMPDFATTINMRGAVMTPGTYTVNLPFNSLSGSASRSFNVVVTPSSTCEKELSVDGGYAWWLCKTTCTSYSGTETNDILKSTVPSGLSNQVYIDLPFAQVRATLNCSAQTLVSTAASGPDFDVSVGNGTFSPRQVVINYSISGGASSSCTTTLTR